MSRRWLAKSCGAALGFSIAATTLLAAPEAPFRVEPLAEGVLLFRPVDTARPRTNALAIEQADGWIVVESQPSPEAAREMLAVLRARSPKPIRYLVLSHPHAESAGGASAFPDTTIVVASLAAHEALSDPAHDFGGVLRARTKGEWVDPPRRLPTLASNSTIDLLDAVNPVRVAPMRPAHSKGNLLVVLPKSAVTYMGPLFYRDRNPYVAHGDVSAWLATWNGMIASWDVERLVPLHGDPGSVDDLKPLRDTFAWLRGQIHEAFVEGVATDGIPAWVTERPGFAERFDVAADRPFHRTMVERALAEVVAERAKRGF
jgi:glyoxylase-like metal-dependent hydrolase (beta-lactamase superfamily II)